MTKTYILDGIWGSHGRWGGLVARLGRLGLNPSVYRYNNSGLRPIGALAERLAHDLRESRTPFHLVAYSMGGLMVREALRLDPQLPLQRAVFLHCPHGGSMAASLLPLPACRDMLPRSPFLRRLDAAPWNHPTLATWCPWDLMVFPGHSAAWRRASRVVRVDFPAHAWPVYSPGVHRLVGEFLAAPCGEDLTLPSDGGNVAA